METRPLSDEHDPVTRRQSSSVLVRMVFEPDSTDQKPRLRVEAVELSGTRKQSFTSISSALAWLGEMLQSEAAGWAFGQEGPVSPHADGSTQ